MDRTGNPDSTVDHADSSGRFYHHGKGARAFRQAHHRKALAAADSTVFVRHFYLFHPGCNSLRSRIKFLRSGGSFRSDVGPDAPAGIPDRSYLPRILVVDFGTWTGNCTHFTSTSFNRAISRAL